MMLKGVVGFSLALLIAMMSISCNFLYNPLHGRENPKDWNSSISTLFAVQTGEGEVMVNFPWRHWYDAYSGDDERVEEALLVYSVGKAIPIRVAPLPPDSGGMFGFELNGDISLYTRRIEGLSDGDEVWFALYPRRGKKWLAPLYETITVRKFAALPEERGVFNPERGFTMDVAGWFVQEDLDETEQFTLGDDSGSGSDTINMLGLQFHLPDRICCLNASLKLNVSGSIPGKAVPVNSILFEHVNDTDRIRMIDYGNESGFTMDEAGGAAGADITEAVNAAVVYGTDTIVIEIESDQTVGPQNYGIPSLSITYVQY